MAQPGLNQYNFAFVVTPSDTVDLNGQGGPSLKTTLPTCDALYIGSAGNVTVMLQDGSQVLITAPPIGSIIPIRAKRVMATGTTVATLNALYQV